MGVPLTFAGTVVIGLELDPGEFADLPVPQLTSEIKRLLSAIAPAVDFYPGDILSAAEQVVRARDA